jgi:hypothetical protein
MKSPARLAYTRIMTRGQVVPEQVGVDHGEIDGLVREAVRDVDQSLLDWTLSLSPRERLRACSNAAVALGKYRFGPPAPR